MIVIPKISNMRFEALYTSKNRNLRIQFRFTWNFQRKFRTNLKKCAPSFWRAFKVIVKSFWLTGFFWPTVYVYISISIYIYIYLYIYIFKFKATKVWNVSRLNENEKYIFSLQIFQCLYEIFYSAHGSNIL